MMIKQLSGESRSWPTEPGATSPPPAVVHDGNGLVKMLFAGAKAVLVAFALYRIGAMHIKAMLGELEDWIGKRGYGNVDWFREKLSRASSESPAVYECVQIMKYFGGCEWSLR